MTLREQFEKEYNWVDKKEQPMFMLVKYTHWLEAKVNQLQNTTHNSDYAKCQEVLRLMFEAAMDADRCGELYDSFDGELLDMAKEALK